MANSVEEPKYTYYLSKIPKVTELHPFIREKYDKEVNSWGKKNFLETPYLSDQKKISGIKYFDPEAGAMLEEGVNVLKKTDKITTDIRNKFSSLPKATTKEQAQLYDELYYHNLGGKKYKRIRKNKRTRKNKKNKRKYTLKNMKKILK